MKPVAVALVAVGLAVAPVTGTPHTLATTIHVDCAASPGGDGTRRAPLSSITLGVAAANALAPAEPVTVSVAQGVCAAETLPISINRPMWVKGSRVPTSRGTRPDGTQTADTLIQTSELKTVFSLFADDVTISHFSIDGGVLPVPDLPGVPPRMMPLGVLANAVGGFVLDQLRMVRMGQTIRSNGSTGRISNNYLAGDSGIFLNGGDAQTSVTVTNTTIDYRVNGITLVGAAGGGGSALHAIVTDTDILTSFQNSGPTNPTAFRINPILTNLTTPPDGVLDVVAERNVFDGTAKYGIMVHAGMPSRTGQVYTGSVTARFKDNLIGGAVLHPALITFTNSRATVLPCELNPEIPRSPDCPGPGLPAGAPLVYWDYLMNSSYVLRHTGELSFPLIDHPSLQPYDQHPLNNVLQINREVVPHDTFVVMPMLLEALRLRR